MHKVIIILLAHITRGLTDYFILSYFSQRFRRGYYCLLKRDHYTYLWRRAPCLIGFQWILYQI